MTENKRIFRCTPSLLNNWSCPRKGAYTDIRQIALAESSGSSSYMDIGTLIHAMLEVYYQLEMWSDLTRDIRRIEAIRYARRKAVELTLDSEDIETAIRTFNDYTAFYGNDNLEILGVEEPFSKILFEDESVIILFEGKIDLIANIGGNKWIIDHKSSGKKQKSSPMSNQFLCYNWALDERAMLVNEIGTQKTLKPEERFKRIAISYTDEHIAEWHMNTIHRVSELIHYIDSGFFPMNLTVCTGKFSLCQFHKICSGVPSDRDRIIARDYVHRKPHDPYEDVDG